MFVPGKPSQPSLMFVGKARSLPYSEAPINYGRKTFIQLALDNKSQYITETKSGGLYYKTYYGRNKFYDTDLGCLF